jgi:hypothetical protein
MGPSFQIITNGMPLGYIEMACIWIPQGFVGLQEIPMPFFTIMRVPTVPDPFIL